MAPISAASLHARPRYLASLFFELLTDRGYRHHGHTHLLTVVHELRKVEECLLLVGGPHEDGNRNRTDVQPHRVGHRDGKPLIAQVLLKDAGASGDPQEDGDVPGGVDRRAQNSSGHGQCVCVRDQGLDCLPRVLESPRRTHEVAVVAGEHNRVPRRIHHP